MSVSINKNSSITILKSVLASIRQELEVYESIIQHYKLDGQASELLLMLIKSRNMLEKELMLFGSQKSDIITTPENNELLPSPIYKEKDRLQEAIDNQNIRPLIEAFLKAESAIRDQLVRVLKIEKDKSLQLQVKGLLKNRDKNLKQLQRFAKVPAYGHLRIL